MEVAKTIESVRDFVQAARSAGKRIGFVPTMGALHIGHVALIKEAGKQCDFVVVSIFVNPAQFGPDEDLAKYPRPIDTDLALCQSQGADVVFVPSVDEMYKSENLTWVNVEELTAPLCGKWRPEHFRGVTTVCAKLFNIVGADAAFFGQKDAQQAIVIKRMVADLNMPLEIVVCPTVRDADGLAVSSRNAYLSAEHRKQAPLIYKSLQKCRQMIGQGAEDSEQVIAEMRKILEQGPSIEIEYISIIEAERLKEVDKIKGKVLAAVAVKLGQCRLIDNIVVDAAG